MGTSPYSHTSYSPPLHTAIHHTSHLSIQPYIIQPTSPYSHTSYTPPLHTAIHHTPTSPYTHTRTHQGWHVQTSCFHRAKKAQDAPSGKISQSSGMSKLQIK